MAVQLEIPDLNSPTSFVGESSADSPTPDVGERINESVMRFLNRDKSLGGKGHVEEYFKKKTNAWYFRYSYRAGNKIKSKHIPGGNANSSLARKRADIIEQMINRGCSTPEILEMIACFKKA